MTKTSFLALLSVLFVIVILAVVNPRIGLAEWIGAATHPTTSQGVAVSENYPGSASLDRVIAFWQARIKRDPEDYIAYNRLGAAYINQARASGDVATYERAETAFRRALQLHPYDLAANSYLATVLYVKHEFKAALTAAEQVYATDKSATQALAVMGDARLELGDYAGAEKAYQVLLAAEDSPGTWSRAAHLAELKGDAERAIQLMQRAADVSRQSPGTLENAAWYQVQVGDLYFNRGQVDEAATRYATALGIFDNYYLGLARLAQARAAQGREAEALQLYQHAVAIIPHPDFLTALGDLYVRLGDHADAQKQYDTVEFIGQLAALNKVIYNRQLALFYANHNLKPAEALMLAANELEYRQDIYAYDAYAWALYANGRYAEAAPAIERAMSLGTQDAKLFYHAGMISKALGQTERARQLLRRALTLNPHFDLLQAERATSALQDLE